jgi:hypothetical protein
MTEPNMWEILKEHKTMLPDSPKEPKKNEIVSQEKETKIKAPRKEKDTSKKEQKLHDYYQEQINDLKISYKYYQEETHKLTKLLHMLLQKFGTIIDEDEEIDSDSYPPVSVNLTEAEYEKKDFDHEPVFFVNKTDNGYTLSFADEMDIITISGCGSDIVTQMYECSIDKRPNVQDDSLVDEIMNEINTRRKNQK